MDAQREGRESSYQYMYLDGVGSVVEFIRLSVLFQRMEIYYLIGYSIFVSLAHVHYGVMIVLQMSDHFNIHTFSLAKKAQTDNREEKPKIQ